MARCQGLKKEHPIPHGLGEEIHSCGVEFPERCNLPGSTIVLEVLECHAHDLRRQSLGQFSTMVYVKAKSMLC